MTKENLINKLTLADTSFYRLRSQLENRIIIKEPSKYRLRLFDIYNKLSLEDLQQLVKIKEL